jgi:hypothetical protein
MINITKILDLTMGRGDLVVTNHDIALLTSEYGRVPSQFNGFSPYSLFERVENPAFLT